MSSQQHWTRAAVTAAVAVGVVTVWAGHRSAADVSPRPPAACLTHVSSDKPIYRGGERVYLRGVRLAASDNRPATASPACQVTIAGPRGETVAQGYAPTADATAAFTWDVPADAAGGTYTATFASPSTGDPPARRAFDVRAYRAPRLKGEVVFLRDGYGPGETVRATMHVDRAEGGLPVGAAVSASAVVDGVSVFTGTTTVDAAGNCAVVFPLPTTIARGDGTLSLTVADGGTVEPIAKTIPILLRTVDVDIYPEGGDLVAGLAGRVYVEARTPAGKPADLSGDIVDAAGQIVASVTTVHEGCGRATFTPAAGQAYALRVTRPGGIDKPIPLPAVKAAGAVVSADAEAYAGGAPVDLHLSATAAGSYTVTLWKRQAEVAAATVAVAANGTAAVRLTPPGWTAGVLTATVTDADGKPVAERLVFRQPEHVVRVKVVPDKAKYVPGGPVHLAVTTTDDRGRPVAATVGVTVSDESVLRLLERRDRPPRLAEQALLEDDVHALADAAAYLDPADARAAERVDLLLATQGWRRFATVDVAKFTAHHGDDGRRALGIVVPVVQQFDRMEALADALPAPMAAAAPARGGGAAGPHWALAKAAAVPRPAVRQQQAQVQQRMRAMDREDRRFGGGGFGGRAAASAPMAPVVREYAHAAVPRSPGGERADFAETIYWSAGVRTDAAGHADVAFATSDSVTAFAATADAVAADGTLGEGAATVTSVRPFYVEPKLPLEVTAGDVVQLPVTTVNSGDTAMSDVNVEVPKIAGFKVGPVQGARTLAGGERQRRLVELGVDARPGTYELTVRASGGGETDTVTRPLRVAAAGFPVELTHGGTLAANGTESYTVDVPTSVVAGSLSTHVALYPTPAGNLTAALKRLLVEPSGCFEQTSSTNYPLVMAGQYFDTHADVDPALVARTGELLAHGYDKLRSFECTDKGYEWFGENPGHECLTAYGLLEFTDMAAVRPVDPAMLSRTRAWLLGRRDGKGGFDHGRRALHTWITDPACANGYCTWALLECGQTGLQPEVGWLKSDAAGQSNSYALALSANALFLAGERDAARSIMDRLAKLQAADGHVGGATTSVVGSDGISLDVETTSLAALAWLRDPAYADRAERAVRFLTGSCQDGRYGSTQSTVLALRAIVAYDKARAHPTAAGRVQLLVDDQEVGPAMPFDGHTHGAIELPDAAERLTPGRHTVAVRMTDGSPLPVSMAVGYHCGTPASSDRCKVTIDTALSSPTAAEGDAMAVDVTVTNKSAEAVPNPVAIVGLPGGLEPRVDQLKELVSAGRLAAYEVRGRDVVLYWRSLDGGQVAHVPVSVVAAVPGTYAGPASRAYLYYADEAKQWQPGLRVRVTPR